MAAAAMSLGLHGWGIHAVRSGAAEAGAAEVRFRFRLPPGAGRERAKINLG
jgi:hypothetical protein